jgi:hypothetical protein
MVEPPPLDLQLEELMEFIIKKCDEEDKLRILHEGDKPAPACEMGEGAIVRKLDPAHCECAQCDRIKGMDGVLLRQCTFCHYGYYEAPEMVYGFMGWAFVRCPSCGKTHAWNQT